MVHKNVICVWWGDRYGIEYVHRLFSSVKRNLSGDFNFYCLTDKPDEFEGSDIKARQLPDGREGWWNKLYLFQNPLFDVEGTVLYLDLDVVIMSNIDSYFDYKEDLDIIAIEDSSPRLDTWNSSVLRFEAGKHPYILEKFKEDKPVAYINSDITGYKIDGESFRGDQDWITHCVPDWKDRIFPKRWTVAYKRAGLDLANKSGAKIILFNGKPDPHEVKHQWVLTNWR